LPNLLAAVEVLPARSVSKNSRYLLHGIRAPPAQVFSKPPFCAGGHAGLCAAVVVDDPMHRKRNSSTDFFNTSCVGVGCVRVGGRP
jgi:hypothetical protein